MTLSAICNREILIAQKNETSLARSCLTIITNSLKIISLQNTNIAESISRPD